MELKNTKNTNREDYIELIKLIILTLGLSSISTTFLTLFYPKYEYQIHNLKKLLSFKINISTNLITILSWMLTVGIFLIITFYWIKDFLDLTKNKSYVTTITSIIHILLLLIFIFRIFINLPTIIKYQNISLDLIIDIFVFSLLTIYSFLRILKALLNWLSKDNEDNSTGIPRMTLLLTLIGTLIGLLLKN